MQRPRALVRRPGPLLAEGLLTHLERVPVDVDLARAQWDGYVAALQDEGWATIEVPPADTCPDSVFVEDTVVVFGDLAVISRPGAEQRKAETTGTEETLAGLGYRIAGITEPGTLDGGDVLKHGPRVWVGLGGRTNRAGLEQLAALLAPEGATVVGVPVTKVLHLKSAVTALPDGTVIGFEPLVDDPAAWEPFLPVPEEPGRTWSSWTARRCSCPAEHRGPVSCSNGGDFAWSRSTSASSRSSKGASRASRCACAEPDHEPAMSQP